MFFLADRKKTLGFDKRLLRTGFLMVLDDTSCLHSVYIVSVETKKLCLCCWVLDALLLLPPIWSFLSMIGDDGDHCFLGRFIAGVVMDALW